MGWKILLTCRTSLVEDELLLRNDDLVNENCILRKRPEGRAQLTDTGHQPLGECTKRKSRWQHTSPWSPYRRPRSS